MLLALVCTALFGLPIAQPARSDEGTKGPVRILSGFAPGGTTDTVARLLAASLRDDTGQVAVVENRSGASGRIAGTALARSAPDGRTLLLAPIVVSVLAPMVFSDLDYDPVRDFAPVAHVANYPFAVFVAADNPSLTVPELVAWAKSHGGPVNYGTPGTGTLPDFLGTLINSSAALGAESIAYQGTGALVTDLIGGRLAFGIDALSDVMELHRGGRIRIIATSGISRSPLLPSVPTLGEQGFPNVEGEGWIALYAPAATPLAVREAYAAEVAAALQGADLHARLLAMGLEPTGSTPVELSAIERRDRQYWEAIIKASGFKAN